MAFQVVVPMVGESITEVTMGDWKKNSGDSVAVDDLLCFIESEKATMEIVAEKAGKLTLKAQPGQTIKVGEIIAEIETNDLAEEQPESEARKERLKKTEANDPNEKKLITSVARKILAEAGISATGIQGSGPSGRITKADAQRAVETESKKDGPLPQRVPEENEVVEQSITIDRSEKRERLTTLRKTIARRLVAAKNETAMLTTFNEIDMSAVIDMRNELKTAYFEKFAVKLGFVSLFTRALCIALQDMPVVNARLDGNEIVYHSYCDISIAVSTEKGLVAPVIRNADSKSVAELEIAIQQLAARARDGHLSIEEMTGGTFTITNGGIFGSLLSTPIINVPQSAVLGMHAIQERPVARNGEVQIRPMMYTALSYDHRIIDGREAVSFLVHVKELLENLNRMLLDL